MTDPTQDYFQNLQQLAQQQDRAKLATLALEFASTVQRMPTLKAELDQFLSSTTALDYSGLVQRIEPQLEAAAAFLDEVDFLPPKWREHDEVVDFIRQAQQRLTLRTVIGAKQRLQDLCATLVANEKAEAKRKEAAAAEAARKAREAAERKAEQEASRQAAWSQSGQDQYGQYAVLSVEGVSQKMRWIPAGNFMMGSPASEPERQSNEKQHRVNVKQGFWLADTACTQALWQAVMGNNPANFKYPENPVEQVSWDDVQRFLQVLNERVSNQVVRLPSEAEWEYACRAGTTTPFSFGSSISPSQANYNGNSVYNGGSKGEYRQKTLTVKSFSPNAWGLYQMHGNVWEWCQDCWADYAHTPDDGTAAMDGDCARRVLRGGSWSFNPSWLRSASRYNYAPSSRNYLIGFRFVCSPPFPDR